MKTAILYGSSTGTTKAVAGMIGQRLGVPSENIFDVAKVAPSIVDGFDRLILGTSTWGHGELQADWADFADGLQAVDLRGKTVALFGCGDQTMADTFCSGVGELYKKLQHTGAAFVGSYPADVYRFKHSEAVINNKPVGLLLDQVNNPELTSGRIDGWLLSLEG